MHTTPIQLVSMVTCIHGNLSTVKPEELSSGCHGDIYLLLEVIHSVVGRIIKVGSCIDPVVPDGIQAVIFHLITLGGGGGGATPTGV